MHDRLPGTLPRPTRGDILLLGALTAFGAITIDLYLPTLPLIGESFAAPPASVQLTLTGFFIGMAFGQLVYGPASDRWGRRPAILIGSAIYIVASLGCAVAPSIDWLIAGRVAQALGACAGMVCARAVVRDRFDHRDSARIFSLLTLVLAVAPMLAPTVGGWLARLVSWRAIFLVLAGFGVTVGLVSLLRLAESRSAETARVARSESAAAGYLDLLRQRRLLGYMLVGALNGATLFTYISGAPDLLITVWGFSGSAFGVAFAFIAFGVIGSSQVNRQLLLRFSPDAILGVASLVAIVCGVLLLTAALLAASKWVVLALLFATLTGNGFIAANALAGALNVDPLRSGATSGLFGASNFAVGAAASAVAAMFHDATPRPMAAVMVAALCLAALSYFGLARPRGEAA